MAFNPDDRYPTAADFQNDIEAYLRRTGSHVSSRDVGKCVAELFADRRTEVRDAIEKRTKQLEAERLSTSGEHSISEPQAPSLAVLSQTGSTVQMSVDPTPEPVRRRNRGLLFAAGGAAALGIAIVGIGVARSGNQPVAAAPQPPALTVPAPVQPAAVTAGTAAAPETIEVTISATPAKAKIFVDDMPVLNPSTLKFPRDGAAHKIRAEAPGYDRRDELVTFNVAALNVALPLDRAGTKKTVQPPVAKTTTTTTATTTTAAVTPPPPPPPADTAAPSTSGTGKKKTTLDTQDPWSKPGN